MADLDWQSLIDSFGRLGAAVLLSGLVGIERRFHGHWADPRTYMAVAIGAAVFAIIGQHVAVADPAAVTRVIQGIAAGVGFLGAGTILKLSGQLEIKGLTTAGSIWVAAALGTACGLALYSLALTGTFISLLVLALFRPLEKRFDAWASGKQTPKDAGIPDRRKHQGHDVTP